MNSTLKLLAVGAGAGVTLALLAWWVADRRLDAKFKTGAAELQSATGTGRQELERRLARGRRALDDRVRRSVEASVPPAVHATITSTLARYSITPETGQMVATVLAGARRAGLLGVGQG